MWDGNKEVLKDKRENRKIEKREKWREGKSRGKIEIQVEEKEKRG